MSFSLAVQRCLRRQCGRSSSRQGISDATQTSAAADGETKGRRLGGETGRKNNKDELELGLIIDIVTQMLPVTHLRKSK